DRQIAAGIGARLDRVESALARSAELRVQLNVMQRALQALTRETAGPAIGHAPAVNAQPPVVSESRYLAFEDEFRGSVESVDARVREYVPIFRGRTTVVDLGCGRGELLAALKMAGIEA